MGPSDERQSHESARQRHEALAGLLYAFGAYLTWGLAPIYFKALRPAGALEIVAHRVVWSTVLLGLIVAFARRFHEVAAIRTRLPVYLATTTLISLNWLLYVWAIHAQRLVEASLGYFINPLVNVVLGVVFLKEALTRAQRFSVLLAFAGVLVLVVRHGQVPLIALALAVSFAFYGLIRKAFRVDPLVGLFVETALVAPLAAWYLGTMWMNGEGQFGRSSWTRMLLLILAGAITAAPLIWFQHAAQRLKLATLGLIQYLSPTCQLLLAVLVYGEQFTAAHAWAFILIWASLGLYTFDALRKLQKVSSSGVTR